MSHGAEPKPYAMPIGEQLVVYSAGSRNLIANPVEPGLFGLLGPMLASMRKIMRTNNGIGIAAPQVAIMLQMAIVEIREFEGQPDVDLVICNPVILEKSGQQEGMEGCLSIPGVRANVKRAAYVKVQYQDENGVERVIEAEGLLARALQHETDHLLGKFFVDHISSLQRGMAIKQMDKYIRKMYARQP